MPFPYYANLSATKKKIYRKSDAIERIPVRKPDAIYPLSRKLKTALEDNARRDVAKHASGICRMVCGDLNITVPTVRIRASRLSSSTSELHGLYEWTEGERPVITVWMKTAAKKQVVAFKSFVRTVLHELCHHVDYTYFKLDDSLHTEGFFKREARLYREVVPAALQGESHRKKKPARKRKRPAEKKTARKNRKSEQLDLL